LERYNLDSFLAQSQAPSNRASVAHEVARFRAKTKDGAQHISLVSSSDFALYVVGELADSFGVFDV
jgi:hypothetical protein